MGCTHDWDIDAPCCSECGEEGSVHHNGFCLRCRERAEVVAICTMCEDQVPIADALDEYYATRRR